DPVTHQSIPLKVSDKHYLSLTVRYKCCWDTNESFLAVEESLLHVFSEASTDPLLRIEYVRGAAEVPTAHIHVHAHRDEMVHLMNAGQRGKAGKRAKRDMIGRLSAYHLPIGGPRFRLCLEDVLQSLIDELGVETVPGY